MWTVELLMKQAERHPGFTFYTEVHPSRRLKGGELVAIVKDLLTDAQAAELSHQHAEFKDAMCFTTSALVAFALLHVGWAQPGDWVKDIEAAVSQMVDEVEAEEKKPRSRSKKK
jgi:hypothetical protein